TDTVSSPVTGTQSGIGVSPAAAAKLVVTTQPSGATAGAAFGGQPVVKVEDAYDNVVTRDGSSVTATLGSGSGSLAGTVTKAAVNGVATFTNLRIDDSSDPKTLHFVDGALTATDSGSFNVSNAAAANIAVNAGNNQSATVNTAVSTAPS